MLSTTTAPAPAAPITSNDFDAIYVDAHGDESRVPWSDGRPHPALVAWLNAIAPSLVRCGGRVAVVGCGLGHDAREVIRRGYDVTAFDCSPAAIAWARTIDPTLARHFHEGDVFALPGKWRHRFDLVVEVNTIQALPRDQRPAAVQAIADLLSPHGLLLVICRGTEQPVREDAGPPWPLTLEELSALTGGAGLEATEPPAVFMDRETPPVRRMRTVYRRG